MDVPEADPPPLRRSTRLTSGKVIRFEATPRAPIKRTKNLGGNTSPTLTVNGSGEMEAHSDDDRSPKKKTRRIPVRKVDASGDKEDMDTDESVRDPEQYQDNEMNIDQDSSQSSNHLRMHHGALDVKFLPDPMHGNPCQFYNDVKKDKQLKHTRVQSPTTPNDTQSGVATRSVHNAQTKVTSMVDYRKEMDKKAKSAAAMDDRQTFSRADVKQQKSYIVKQRVKTVLPRKETLECEKQGKPAVDTGDSSKGFLWYFCRLVLLALFGSAAMFAYKAFPLQQRTKGSALSSSNQVKLEQFSNLLSHLKAQFLSQRTDLWTRSRIHLEKHLRDVQPTEPVSLILTSGVKAEKTMHCLAKGFASTFSSALNGSVLHIDGTSKAGQQSDVVKLDIDRQLREAFDGDTFAAVVHNLEELPPGSTIIFYRYCDHENSAYKRVFLLFTVLLPQDEVSGELTYVEEKVQDYLKERLVGSSSQTSFNEMDNDKFGGLWSRISHLILPVVPETEVEQNGC